MNEIDEIDKIDKIYEMLHWNSRFDEQLKGIKLARELEDLSLIILPYANGESKAIWGNCARALFELTDEELEKYLPSLFEWIEDLNWPGALIILDRLKLFSGERLKIPFLELFKYAVNLNNEEGLMWIDVLSELLDNDSLKSELPKEVLGILQKHYHNCAWWDNEI